MPMSETVNPKPANPDEWMLSSANTSIKILIADDDPVMRTLLKRRLERAGFEIVVARDGKEALDLLTNNIGVALLDLKMPVMDGIECLRHIREKYQDLSPIMLTASEDISNAVEAMKHGALDYVIKPFNVNQLIALINKAFQTYQKSKRLRQVEAQLREARDHEIFIASKIQRTLLIGRPPDDISGLQIVELTIPSQKIDGDFFDFFRLDDHSIDIVVADVMGKGILSAFMGAAMKSHLLRALNELMYADGTKTLPQPEDIIALVHALMIRQMEDLEIFVTLCYARFDLAAGHIIFVDCGHVRTIHHHRATGKISRLQGTNMPLGFPETEPFKQLSIPFEPGDIFFFYSDGLTEARDQNGNLYNEDRLVDFIQKNAAVQPKQLVKKIRQEITSFTQSQTFEDDFTCVLVKTEPGHPAKNQPTEASLEIKSRLEELTRVRSFVRSFCENLPETLIPGVRINLIEVAVTEVTTNIIKHAYHHRANERIQIKISISEGNIVILFYDWGEQFNPATVPPPPDISSYPEGGMGYYIIQQTIDEVCYSRDETGKNCACLKVVLTEN
jgi:sigma-B regulation protein RsbU (phosphoserine phosphatase)